MSPDMSAERFKRLQEELKRIDSKIDRLNGVQEQTKKQVLEIFATFGVKNMQEFQAKFDALQVEAKTQLVEAETYVQQVGDDLRALDAVLEDKP